VINLTLRLHGVEEALAELDRREALARTNIERAMEAWGKKAEQQMIDTHTFQNRTYRLEGSIGYDLYVFVGAHAHLAVFALAPYASQVEFGHPGPPPARPYPFFWPVFWNLEPEFTENLSAAWTAGWNGQEWG